ncbi:MAG: 2-oxoacid:acceptor oxidoreductase family protein [Alphaproteobacteria bacterium]|nr:2-oxoacid:acceptor oxidoreductase family protein [Alphaproteobacteria bacterium]
MYRIRFHGRGGQGIVTASRVLGTAFFLEGFEVQDAPRYGAERRGAPIFAYVRADHVLIAERGPILNPDLVVVADDTLVGVPAAGVLQGLGPDTVILIDTAETAEAWRDRLNIESQIVVLPKPTGAAAHESHFFGTACTGAAVRLLDTIELKSLDRAIETEFDLMGTATVARNKEIAHAAYDALADSDVQIAERPASRELPAPPGWIDLPREDADISAPTIHAGLTSVEVRTGLWRTIRPIIDYDICRHCWWVCSTFCPDDAISVSDENEPVIDYDHCKGCMICVAQCPPHAIVTIPEVEAAALDDGRTVITASSIGGVR